MPQKRLVFNLTRGPGRKSTADTLYLNANDPEIVLGEAHIEPRTDIQQAAIQSLGELKLTPQDVDPFDDDLLWAYRQYIVHRLEPVAAAVARNSGNSTSHDLLGDRPARLRDIGSQNPSKLTERLDKLDELRAARSLAREVNATLLSTAPEEQPAPAPPDELIYLFNIIVALEWLPSEGYLRQLEWAFQRGSDFLYDVTNGCMAFGQVVIGGPELLDSADIQIMASNRLLPRSWVGGLIMSEKRMPIRLGRGIWVRRRQGIISWDEPEGYRSLVHEWCHYALALKDEYIAVRGVARRDPATGLSIAERNDLVLPRARVTSTSIMATAEGNSELRNLLEISGDYGATLKATLDKHYPTLTARLEQRSSGPGNLPLPFPAFRRAGSLEQAWQEEELGVKMPFEQRGAQPYIPRDEERVPEEGWEIYLVRGGLEQPERVIAQGQVDASPTKSGFPVYGGRDPERDQLVLVGRAGDGARAWVSPLQEQPVWQEIGLSDDPFAVVPGVVDPKTLLTTPVTVVDGEFGETEARLFPLSNSGGVALTPGNPTPLATLDGILFFRRGDKLTIGCYSQGGGPTSAPNVIFDPVAAGSSNGDALLFFYEESPGKYPGTDKIRVVTMALHTLRGAIPQGYHPLSHVYAVASNQPLDTRLLPTLTIACRQADLAAGEQLYIGRLDGASWKVLASHTPPGITMAAISLSKDGGKLIDSRVPAGQHVEYFRLFAKVPADAEAPVANTA